MNCKINIKNKEEYIAHFGSESFYKLPIKTQLYFTKYQERMMNNPYYKYTELELFQKRYGWNVPREIMNRRIPNVNKLTEI